MKLKIMFQLTLLLFYYKVQLNVWERQLKLMYFGIHSIDNNTLRLFSVKSLFTLRVLELRHFN